ncbi:hypothetical protein CA54_30730 [Symmachiella macrocystis]|uniref:Uncharacterized protein n=1 Tax=Symmachiella macrocystis TaxID=2527985 RepID=A0A5C6BPT0_9PLAN|nr:hypothetical protein CA54_30730 [Symmachiella macrocystis]
MAVYQCQCDLVLSTSGMNAHCPRCGHPLSEKDRLFVGEPLRNITDGNEKSVPSDSCKTTGSAGIVAHDFYGFAFAIAHIRAIHQTWLSS